MDNKKYYSQHGEDYLVWRLFGKKNDGICVDVGAYDGVYLSNSYFLELQGWSGICIEANPKYFRLCQENRNGFACINAACVGNDQPKIVKLFTEQTGLYSSVYSADHESQPETTQNSENDSFVQVKTVTLDEILKEFLPSRDQLDILSIDVEGSELDVLKGLNIGRYRPRLIIVEANSRLHHEELARCLMTKYGYYYGRAIGPNIFYCDRFIDAIRLPLIGGFCEFADRHHPLGESYDVKRGKKQYISRSSISSYTKHFIEQCRKMRLFRMRREASRMEVNVN